MLSRSQHTIAAALAALAIGAPAATAMPAGPTPKNGEVVRTTSDARGEHAASLSDAPGTSGRGGGDLRTPDATEPFVRPVVVEVGDSSAPGFDWVAAIIGIAGGLGFAVLAGAAVSGGRRRRPRPSTV